MLRQQLRTPGMAGVVGAPDGSATACDRPHALFRISLRRDMIEHMFERRGLWGQTADRTALGGYCGAVYTSSLEEQAALVDLLRRRPGGMSWNVLTAEVLRQGGPRQLAQALDADILFVSEDRQADLDRARVDVAQWGEDGLTFITIVDDRYPGSVRDIHQAPPFLFAEGTLRAEDTGVSVVGSRDVSPLGAKMAASVAAALVDLSVTVISGLAKGVDTAAHTAAIEAGGRPVGLIATGINRAYPAENRGLHEQVAEHGLLLSQFWPDAPPQKHNFLMRNATMSGYGIATVVIEAGEHSGARAQARMAIEHGRPVILTDLVVDRTNWAKTLINRPGVFVASSTDDVISVVRDLIDEPRRVDTILDALVAS